MAQVVGVPVEEVDPQAPLCDLGLDALACAHLAVKLEAASGVSLTLMGALPFDRHSIYELVLEFFSLSAVGGFQNDGF